MPVVLALGLDPTCVDPKVMGGFSAPVVRAFTGSQGMGAGDCSAWDSPALESAGTMYYAVVATLMFAFPLVCIAVDASQTGAAISAALIGKWFVFWSVGCRLFVAGARQIVQPAYTARVILGLQHGESHLLVRELGFANVALGAIGMLTLFIPSWRLAVALAGGVFYGLVGINHVFRAHRNRLENVAMVSDLFVSLVLLWVCVSELL